MAGTKRLAIIASKGTLDMAYPPLILATTAASMGWEVGVNKKFSEAPQFYGLYTLLIVFGAFIILLPGIPLFPIMYISQVINGIVLPLILVFMLILINYKKLMGIHTNGRAYNIISWISVIILVGMGIAFLVSLFGL